MTTRPADPPRAPRDGGFTLLEAVVAIALFAVMSTAVLNLVVTAVATTREDAARTAANNLAVRELEIARDAFGSPTRGPEQVHVGRPVVNGSPLPGGRVGEPYVVDGVPFTVTRTSEWRTVGSEAATVCDEGSSAELSTLHVTVEVTWPELERSERPAVRMDTVMTPRKGSYQKTDGHISVKVVDEAGAPVPGVAVQAVSTTAGVPGAGSAVTSREGCALVAHLRAATYAITLSLAGHVGVTGDPTARTTATVQQAQLWRGTIEYARPATLQATFVTAPDFALPPGLVGTPTSAVPITLGNSALLPSGSRAVPGSGTTRTLSGLWPYPSGYQLWSGGCTANDPVDRRDPVVASPAGSTTPVDVRLAPLTVTAPAGVALVAKQAADGGCRDGATVALGAVPAGGRLATSLPWGTRRVERAADASRGASVTLDPEGAAGAVTVP